MKRQRKLFWLSLIGIFSFSILVGTGVSAKTSPDEFQRIDGFYKVQDAANETIRSIYVSKTRATFTQVATIFLGTNEGKFLSATMDSDNERAQPAFKTLSGSQEPIRDIYFSTDNQGYILKNDGIYRFGFDGKNWTFSQFVTTQNMPQREGSTPRLYSMAFIPDTSKVCVGGAYILDETENDLDKQLLFCTDNINGNNPRWKKPKMPEEGVIQIVNVNFTDRKHGWATGTEGTIWFSDNGGDDWKKQAIETQDHFLKIFGLGEKRAWAVGFNNQVWYRSGEAAETVEDARPNPDGEFHISDIVQVKARVFAEMGFSSLGDLRGLVTEIKRDRTLTVRITTVLPENLRETFNPLLENLSYDDVEKVGSDGEGEATTDPEVPQPSAGRKEWANRSVPIPDDKKVTLRNVMFASSGENEKNGWIVGDSGTILYTRDGGRNWQPVLTSALTRNQQAELKNIKFYSIFVDDSYCWVAGSQGTVVRIKYKP